MKDKKFILIVISYFILTFLVCFFVMAIGNRFISVYYEFKKKYDFSSATVIDTRVSDGHSGLPCYYFIYKFPDGKIVQKQVTTEEYYIYLDTLSK